MGKRTKQDRPRLLAAPSVERPHPQCVGGPAPTAGDRPVVLAAPVAPTPPPALVPAPPRARLAVKAKKCCRSMPRCKSCPVVLMRAARLQESGLTGKDLKKAVKRARVA